MKRTQSWPNRFFRQSVDYIFEKRLILSAAIFFLVAGLISCEKPEESIGIDLQPEDDILRISAIDSFTVVVRTIEEDSIRTEGVTPALFGAYIDPVFGFTKAGHYTELRLSTANPRFYTDGSGIDKIVIDSMVLNLSYLDLQGIPIYGSLGDQFVQVFEIDDTLSLDSIYYDNSVLNIIEEDLVEPGFNLSSMNYRDSSIVDEVAIRPSLRLPIKKEIGQRILDGTGESGLTATEFIELINGLYITVDENASGVNLRNTGIVSFNNFDRSSRLEMYYRDTFGSDPDTLFYDFEIRGSTGKFNVFEHDFGRGAEAELVRQINYPEVKGDKSLYVQSMSGTKLEIDLPYIENLRDSTGLAISKAELVLPVREGTTNRFAPPIGMFIFGLDEEGDAFLIDDQLDGAGFVDGQYDPVEEEYRFIISRFLQQVISSDREFYGLEIVTERAAFSPNRAVINGPNYPSPENPENNLRLEISFINF